MKTPQQLVAELIAREGGYVDNAADKGGKTRFGITEAVARANHYAGDMAALPIELATQIYMATYWTGPRLDQVYRLAPRVAGELFDTGVNMGVGVAAKFLRRALVVLTGDALAPAGTIDAATITTLSTYLARRAKQNGEAVLIELLNALQGTHYAEIVEAKPAQRAFIYGWISNRVMDRSVSG